LTLQEARTGTKAQNNVTTTIGDKVVLLYT
jgi:hypothetical protein